MIEDDAIAQAALSKIKTPDWLPYECTAAIGGVLVKGVVPRVITRGARKGQPTLRGADKSTEQLVIVSHVEIDNAQKKIDRRLAKTK